MSMSFSALIAIFLSVQCDGHSGPRETLYLFPTQPYVLSVPAVDGQVMLKTTPQGNIDVMHLDTNTGTWSSPKPLSLENGHIQGAMMGPHNKTAYVPGPANFQMHPHVAHNSQGHDQNMHVNREHPPMQAYYMEPNNNAMSDWQSKMVANPMIASVWMDQQKSPTDQQNKNYSNMDSKEMAAVGAVTNDDKKGKDSKDSKDSKDPKDSKGRRKGASKSKDSKSSSGNKNNKKSKAKKESGVLALKSSAAIATGVVSLLLWFM